MNEAEYSPHFQPVEHDAKVLPEAIHESYDPYVPPTHSTDPEVYYGHEDAEVVAPEDGRYKNEELATSVQSSHRRRFGRGWKIIGVIIALLLVAAVIGGAVGGVLGSKKKSVSGRFELVRNKGSCNAESVIWARSTDAFTSTQ